MTGRFIAFKGSTAATRVATYNGKETLVVPVVAIVEGVLWASNAPGPELALASVFGKVPDGWNGRPVVLNHPQQDGTAVSANAPTILEAQAFGQLFNTRLEDTKLKTEAWLDTERAKVLGGDTQAAVERIQSGELVEVSIGAFIASEETEGEFQGRAYERIWRECTPDHLAILDATKEGACSTKDGCGAPRTASAAPLRVAVSLNTLGERNAAALIAAGKINDGAWTFATADSDTLLGSPADWDEYARWFLAIDSEASQKTKGRYKYPIGKDGQVYRRALVAAESRATQNGTDAIASAAKRLLDSMPKEPTAAMEKSATEGKLPKGLGARVRGLLARVGLAVAESDVDLRYALKIALDAAGEVLDWDPIVAVYADERQVVYSAWDGDGWKLFRRGYTLATGGAVTLADARDVVRPNTTFVPVTAASAGDPPKEVTMDKIKQTALIAAIKASPRNPFTDEQLAAKPIEELEMLAKFADEKKPETRVEVKAPVVVAAAVETPEPKPVTKAEYLAQMPAEMREAYEYGERQQAERRAALVAGIKASPRNGFTDEQLAAKPFAELEQLAKLADAPVADYSARPAPRAAADADTVPAAPDLHAALRHAAGNGAATR